MDFNILTSTLMVVLLLMTSSCNGDADESSCDFDGRKLKKPEDDCSVTLTYPSPVGELSCDADVDTQPKEKPETIKLKVTKDVEKEVKDFPASVLIFMYDQDAGKGFVHWVIKGEVDKDGNVKPGDSAEVDYYPPSPPGGQKHRYQVFVFSFDKDNTPSTSSSKHLDTFCDFVKRNKLNLPLGSTQFHYKS